MNEPQYFAAVDLGASSGRVILGALEDGTFELTETIRFRNGPITSADGIHWDIKKLYEHLLQGISNALQASAGKLAAVGIDSWGVDYGRIGRDQELLEPPFHYRDLRTEKTPERFFAKFPAEQLYAENGLQVQPFNTIFQLVSAANDSGWEATDCVLLTPDLFGYWLTGRKLAEVTMASTTGLLNVTARTWSPTICAHLERVYRLPTPAILPELVEPGVLIGKTRPQIFPQQLQVVTVGSHDTASAVVAVPATSRNFAYISSGTWSLVGLELDTPVCTTVSQRANFTNELGPDNTVRFLKNVMGLWVLNECVRNWEENSAKISVAELIAAASELEPLTCVVNIDDERLLPPGDMPARLLELANQTCQELDPSPAAITRCIFDSLALAYRRSVRQASELSGKSVEVIHIVGGGSQNALLCQLTAEATGLRVVAGPAEGTALGNLLIQARTCGALQGDLHSLREVSYRSSTLIDYLPGKLELSQRLWDAAEDRITDWR